MAPSIDRVQSDTMLPAGTRVVVIGGGIIGVCTAFFLARKGVPVVLCEKGEIAGEQSSRNWGWCRKMGRDPREVPLAIEALRLWPEMNSLVGAETGFRRSGIVYLCRTQQELAKREAWLEQVGRPFQLDTRLLTGSQVNATLPGLAGSWLGALSTASDGRAEPAHAAPAIAEAARRLGATILTRCAVRGIETQGGRIAGVVTERGTIACRCGRAGRWRLVAAVLPPAGPAAAAAEGAVVGDANRTAGRRPRSLGQRVRLRPAQAPRRRLHGRELERQRRRYRARLVPVHAAISCRRCGCSGGELRLRLGGRFLQELAQPRRWKLDRPSPFEAVRMLDPPPHQPILDQARTHVSRPSRCFATCGWRESWGGMIDVTPDGIPVISGVDTLPGFFIATGFTGHGFGIAPAAGRLMAELVAGETPVVDPAPFRYSRFSDGTRPEPYPLA